MAMKNDGPSPMKDRFKGSTPSLPSTGTRHFDTGSSGKGYMGAECGKYKGTTKNQKTESGPGNTNTKVRGSSTSLGGSSGMALGRPQGAAPSYPGVKGGHGPKTGSHQTGTTIQKGSTGGKDKSPKPLRDRFKGGSHGGY